MEKVISVWVGPSMTSSPVPPLPLARLDLAALDLDGRFSTTAVTERSSSVSALMPTIST